LPRPRLDGEETVILCRPCAEAAPSDPLVFQEVYLRFASTKELLRRFAAPTEEQAVRKLALSRGLNARDLWARYRLWQNLARDAERRGGLIPPYGYEIVDGRLVVNEAEVAIVKQIFEWYLKGSGVGGIAARLNANRTPTKTGKRWERQTVANILHNPLYCGYVRGNGAVRPGSHRALIDVEVFNRVQILMDQRIRRPDQKGRNLLLIEEKSDARTKVSV
jgi:hypothetical protein